jgi:hypothetical protein
MEGRGGPPRAAPAWLAGAGAVGDLAYSLSSMSSSSLDADPWPPPSSDSRAAISMRRPPHAMRTDEKSAMGVLSAMLTATLVVCGLLAAARISMDMRLAVTRDSEGKKTCRGVGKVQGGGSGGGRRGEGRGQQGGGDGRGMGEGAAEGPQRERRVASGPRPQRSTTPHPLHSAPPLWAAPRTRTGLVAHFEGLCCHFSRPKGHNHEVVASPCGTPQAQLFRLLDGFTGGQRCSCRLPTD